MGEKEIKTHHWSLKDHHIWFPTTDRSNVSGVLDGTCRYVFWGTSHGCYYTYYLTAFIFSLCLSALVGGPQERVSIYSAMQFALHIKVIHFLFSTNAFSYGAL